MVVLVPLMIAQSIITYSRTYILGRAGIAPDEPIKVEISFAIQNTFPLKWTTFFVS